MVHLGKGWFSQPCHYPAPSMTSTRPSIHLEFLVLWGKTCSASFPDLIHERTLLPCPLTYASPPRLFHRLASGMEVFLLELACKSVEVTLYHSILHRWFLPMERTDLCPQFLLPVGFSFQSPQVAKEWTLQSCPPTALQNLGSGWWGAGEGVSEEGGDICIHILIHGIVETNTTL